MQRYAVLCDLLWCYYGYWQQWYGTVRCYTSSGRLVLIARGLLDGLSVAQETAHLARNVDIGSTCFLFPQCHNRVRAYVAYPQEAYACFQGAAALPAVVAACVQGGLPAAAF